MKSGVYEGSCRTRVTDGADHLAAHLLDGRKHVFNACPGLGDAVVATLLRFRQRLVGLTFALDLIAIAVFL